MATAIAESDWAAELFPTLGFFGLETETSLGLTLERPGETIRLSIDTGVA